MKKTVFVVDDSLSSLTLAADAVKSHYAVITIPSGQKAIDMLEKIMPDLILLDIEMPEMDGFEVLQYLKDDKRYKEIPVIFLTSCSDYAAEVKALKMGVSDFITKPFNPAVLLNRVRHHVDISRLIAERTAKLHNARQGAMFVLADIVENRDLATGDHLGRASKLVKMLLDRMLEDKIYYDEIKDWDFELVAECSLLHDVGKINMPDAILKKPGKLTDDEFEQMKTHADSGKRIIEKMTGHGRNAFLQNAAMFAAFHHERWDGTGYPQGLVGEEIPLHGRIMAVVDVYDALLSKRIYKEAIAPQTALEIIVSEKGKSFDPQIVDVFCSIHDDVLEQIYI